MWDVILAMIIFVLDLFKFPVTLHSFTRLPSNANFIFCYSLAAADSCCCPFASSFLAVSCSSSSASFSTMSFNLSCCPHPIFSSILLYNKEAVSRTLCSLSASASRVAVTGAEQRCIILKWYF